MHIPDSVISPSTAIVLDLVMLPIWAVAAKATSASLKSKQIPLLAMCAAFSFTVMMFNIPALGGTTAHAVGGTLLAVLLGPAAAIIGMSVTLAVQALLFNDGGILALGANCITMAVALPCVGYYAYKLVMWAARNHHAAPLAAGAGNGATCQARQKARFNASLTSQGKFRKAE